MSGRFVRHCQFLESTGFNWSSVRERRLCSTRSSYPIGLQWVTVVRLSRRGPASENAGYAAVMLRRRFQLVQRPRTPVMFTISVTDVSASEPKLQLVQRPRTPVMPLMPWLTGLCGRGFNWSSVRERRLWLKNHVKRLQLVQRPRTPVMKQPIVDTGNTSMGPASENAGYDGASHGETPDPASIGPASENAGYAPKNARGSWFNRSFNWSSVRERRLCIHLSRG